MRPTSAKSAKRPKSAMSPKCPKSAMSPQSAMSAISPKNRLSAISPKTTPSGPQNGTAADAAIKQFGIWIPENKKRTQNWGRLADPLADLFCNDGPILGSTRRTPKWDRRGRGDQKTLAFGFPNMKNGPKTGSTWWPQFGVRQTNPAENTSRQHQFEPS